METYRVFKDITVSATRHNHLARTSPASLLWEEVAHEWAPSKSYLEAQEIGAQFGEGLFLFVPAGETYCRVQQVEVVARQAFDFVEVEPEEAAAA